MPIPRDIPRDITCWYCRAEQHGRCFSTQLCACRVCGWAERIERAESLADAERRSNDFQPRRTK